MVSRTKGLWITMASVGAGERQVFRSGDTECVLTAYSSISCATLAAHEDSGGVMLSEAKLILPFRTALGLKPSPDEA
jgi:hypothetical protein